MTAFRLPVLTFILACYPSDWQFHYLHSTFVMQAGIAPDCKTFARRVGNTFGTTSSIRSDGRARLVEISIAIDVVTFGTANRGSRNSRNERQGKDAHERGTHAGNCSEGNKQDND